MALTPEPIDDAERYRSRVRVALMVAALCIGAVTVVAWPNDVERAMSEGCDALPLMADAIGSADRATFDETEDQASRLGFAAFRGSDLTDDASLIEDAVVAARAYSTLYDAAYEPAEGNSGESVWRGSELTAAQQESLVAGLAVCENY